MNKMGVPDMALDDNGCINEFGSSLGDIRSDEGCTEEDGKPILRFYRDFLYKNSSKDRFIALGHYVGSGPHDEKLFYLVSGGYVPFGYGQTVDRTGAWVCWINYWSLNEYREGCFCFKPQYCAKDLVVKYKGLIWYFDKMVGNRFFFIGGGGG